MLYLIFYLQMESLSIQKSDQSVYGQLYEMVDAARKSSAKESAE